MDQRYRYSGPLSAATLPDGREVMLHPGQSVMLPEDNGYVATLVALGRLVVMTEPIPSQNPEEPDDAR